MRDQLTPAPVPSSAEAAAPDQQYYDAEFNALAVAYDQEQQEAAQHRAPAASLYDRALGAYISAKTILMERQQRVSEKWDAMSTAKQRTYKIGTFLTSAAGFTLALQGLRMTGAAAHEITSITDALAHVPHAQAPDPVLPADLHKAPAAHAIGNWQPRTGHGSVWGEATDYADDLGYGKLTNHQKWEVTAKLLTYNHRTWHDAKYLSNDFKLKMPTQQSMLDTLHHIGAKHTHAAHRAPALPGSETSGDSSDHTHSTSDASSSGGHPDTVAASPIDQNHNGVPDAAEKVAQRSHGLTGWAENWAGTKWGEFMHQLHSIPHIGQELEKDPPSAWWARNHRPAILMSLVLGTVGLYNYQTPRSGRLAFRRPKAGPVLPAGERPTEDIPRVSSTPPASSTRTSLPLSRSATAPASPVAAEDIPPPANTADVVTEPKKRHPLLRRAAEFGGTLLLSRLWERHAEKKAAEETSTKQSSASS